MQTKAPHSTGNENEHLFCGEGQQSDEAKREKPSGDDEMMVIGWEKGRADKRGPDCNRKVKAAAAVIAAALNSADEG
ncbi:hypothetical protein C0J50_22191 [Silurus asotus]|uniref:Uncharacterized protein n=1 Tax=Silurus asotus TaxID=30991 RepID=A0AAD5FJR6_SILAS|nr:hypothetical protein C0J50_22191 [Silurus asotus]